jgi:hypothetical protein
MSFKIKRTRDYVAKAQRHTRWKHDVRNMDRALALIARCEDDQHYYDECMKDVEAKYGRSIWYSEDGLFNAPEKRSGRIFSRFEKETDENRKEVRAAFRRAVRKSARLYRRDWNRLFKLLRDELANWWD